MGCWQTLRCTGSVGGPVSHEVRDGESTFDIRREDDAHAALAPGADAQA
jgi:hypothetical protein